MSLIRSQGAQVFIVTAVIAALKVGAFADPVIALRQVSLKQFDFNEAVLSEFDFDLMPKNNSVATAFAPGST